MENNLLPVSIKVLNPRKSRTLLTYPEARYRAEVKINKIKQEYGN